MKILAALTSLFAPMEPVLSSDGVSARFARMLTDRNNPDHIILAHVLQSLATEYDKWSLHSPVRGWPKNFDVLKYNPDKHSRWFADSDREFRLTRTGDKPMVVSAKVESATAYHDKSRDEFFRQFDVTSFTVSGVSVNKDLCQPFLAAANDIKVKNDDAVRIAAMAKAEMEANEKKWEIVESVLGMKREDGLLVSAIKCLACGATDDCDSYCDGVVARA